MDVQVGMGMYMGAVLIVSFSFSHLSLLDEEETATANTSVTDPYWVILRIQFGYSWIPMDNAVTSSIHSYLAKY